MAKAKEFSEQSFEEEIKGSSLRELALMERSIRKERTRQKKEEAELLGVENLDQAAQ